MMDKNGNNRDWLKTAAAVLGIIAVIVTLVTVLLIGPVKDTAVEAKEKAEGAITEINELDGRVIKIETKMENVDKNVERLMRDVGVPPVTDVPAGDYPADAPKEK